MYNDVLLLAGIVRLTKGLELGFQSVNEGQLTVRLQIAEVLLKKEVTRGETSLRYKVMSLNFYTRKALTDHFNDFATEPGIEA